MLCWVESGLDLAAPVQRRCQTLRRRMTAEPQASATATVQVTQEMKSTRCHRKASPIRFAVACRLYSSAALSLEQSLRWLAPSWPSLLCVDVAHTRRRQSLPWISQSVTLVVTLSRGDGHARHWAAPIATAAASRCTTWVSTGAWTPPQWSLQMQRRAVPLVAQRQPPHPTAEAQEGNPRAALRRRGGGSREALAHWQARPRSAVHVVSLRLGVRRALQALEFRSSIVQIMIQ